MESFLGLVPADEWWVSMACFIVISLSTALVGYSNWKTYKIWEGEFVGDKKEINKNKRLEELNRLKQDIKKEENTLINITG